MLTYAHYEPERLPLLRQLYFHNTDAAGVWG